jgi:hypothetical protein
VCGKKGLAGWGRTESKPEVDGSGDEKSITDIDGRLVSCTRPSLTGESEGQGGRSNETTVSLRSWSQGAMFEKRENNTNILAQTT